MTSIGYDDITNVLLSLTDPNTGGATYEVPGVSSPKINGSTSIYNESGGDGQGIAGWSTDISWTPGVGSISWTSGVISLPDGTSINASSGYASITAPTYIYVDTTDGSVYSTTHTYDAVGENKIMICAAFPNSGKNVTFKAFGCADQNSLATGADIAAGTIVANNIASGTITANQIASGTITANEIASNTITASEIASGAVTASKIDVYQLSSITANLGDVSVGSNSDSKIRIYPNGQQGRIDFSYEGDTVGYMVGQSVSGPGDTLGIVGGSNGSGNIALSGKVWCLGKLRIPVGVDLY